MSTATQQWQSTLGPIQAKRLNKAFTDMRWAAKSRKEITGMVGGECRETVLVAMCGDPQPIYGALYEQIGARFEWRATPDALPDILQAVAVATRQLQEAMPVDDLRKTPAQVAEESQARQVQETHNRDQAEARAAQVAELVAKLKADYPWWAEHADKSPWARAAANIKRELAQVFPGIAFSVKSSSFSMGNSVDVRWTLGPTTAQVDAIIGKYQHGDFDGMQDMYEYDQSAAGAAVEQVLGRSKYVHSHRDTPEGLQEQVGRDLCAMQHVEYEGMNTRKLLGACDDEWISTHIHRLLHITAFAPGEAYAGVRPATDEERMSDDYGHWCTIIKTAPVAAPAPKPAPAPVVLPAPAPVAPVERVTVAENVEKDGVEIRFPAKPASDVLDRLKAAGWRWSRFSACWYHKRSPEALAFAQQIATEGK